MNQLELLPPPAPPPAPSLNPTMERLIAGLKEQEAEGVAIARELGHECDRTRDLPVAIYSLVWAEYHRRHPHPRHQSAPPAPPPQGKSRSYRPWSLERKQRERVRRLYTRLRKRYSFPDLLIPAIQEEVIKNPWYFGCCPLPGSGDSFPANIPTPEYLAAIARESALLEDGL